MYKYCITRFSVYILFGLCLILSSCGTRAPRVDYRELARAAVRLEMDIDANDNHRSGRLDWSALPTRRKHSPGNGLFRLYVGCL